MVGNLTYMGVLRCGDARSELMPELQIIPQEEFEAAQRIREDRSAHAAEEAEHHVPVDRHCFPITFTAATVVQGSP